MFWGFAFICACLVAGAAQKARALSWSGAMAAAFVGFALFGFAGGWGAAALLLFFVLSSGLSRWGKSKKEAMQFEKGGERDAGQVFANGGVAALCAVALPFFPHSPVPALALLGAIASANADTWATEIGSLAKGNPRHILNFKPALPGTSGAVSWQGTLASLAGAFVIACVALGFGLGGRGVVFVTVGGLIGSLFDSLLGATVQAQYRCVVCGKITERREHCYKPTVLQSGFAFVHNDFVNALATGTGAAIAALGSLLMHGPTP
jgi:uncharacterized protein (TIGR00297 family)